MAHQELALHAIMKGVDKIPDKIWDLIPGHKEKKPDDKERATKKEEEREPRGSQRRASDTPEYRSSREHEKASDTNRGRQQRPRRATADSKYRLESDDHPDYRGDRERRSRARDEQHVANHDTDNCGREHSSRPPISYPYSNAPPNPLIHPASYPTAPYGQPVPFAYVAMPPLATHGTQFASGRGGFPSTSSGRSTSNAPPMWSNEASRRSSISNIVYSPPTTASPCTQPNPVPEPQAHHTHPAYTNGETPSTAARMYTPSIKPSDPVVTAGATPAHPLAYATPSPTPCPNCGHSPAPSPLELPHPRPTHTLSFPFLHSNASLASNLYTYSPPVQPPSASLHALNTVPSDPTPSSVAPSNTGIPSTAVLGRRHSLATSSIWPPTTQSDLSTATNAPNRSPTARPGSVAVQGARRSSLGVQQQRRPSTTLDTVKEKSDDDATKDEGDLERQEWGYGTEDTEV